MCAVWIPPVSIPSFSGGPDYSANLYQGLSGIGDAFVANRNARTQQSQFAQGLALDQQRLAQAQTIADRNYALDQQRYALGLAKMNQPTEQWLAPTPEQLAAHNLKPEDAGKWQVSSTSQQFKSMGGGPLVTVDTGAKAGAAWATGLGSELAKDFVTRRQGAQDAANSLASSQEARKLLDSGVITGFGADYIVSFNSALQQMGFNASNDATANTQAYIATRAADVGRIIKLFGAGTGLSDADRQYAELAAAGKITLNEESIRRILDINDRAARGAIEAYNRDALAVPADMAPYPLTIDMPAMVPPPVPGSVKPGSFKTKSGIVITPMTSP